MNKCLTCKFWNTDLREFKEENIGWGYCTNQSIRTNLADTEWKDNNSLNPNKDSIVTSNYKGFLTKENKDKNIFGIFQTGQNFGCVHHVKNEIFDSFVNKELNRIELLEIIKNISNVDQMLELIRFDRPWLRIYSVVSFEIDEKFNWINVKVDAQSNRLDIVGRPVRDIFEIPYPLVNIRPLSEEELEKRK